MAQRKGILERLEAGEVIIGDGGFTFALEKRGYVRAGAWTPEATIEHPEAVRQLHREFLRAGSDVMQTFTFYSTDDTLHNRGNKTNKDYTCRGINDAACRIAHEVASEGDALVAGGVSQTCSYLSGLGKEVVQKEFKDQVEAFVENKVDFIIAEYFEYVEEIEWAIEVCIASGLPTLASMNIGTEGDMAGNSVGECAIRMAKTGASVVGVNCHFDPFMSLKSIKMMKEALDRENIKVYLMAQPLGFLNPDAAKGGYLDLPEFPFALEPRLCTRWDIHRYAREAYNLGVRYIGGCCGFESYHIRAIAEELRNEKGKLPEGSKKHDLWGGNMKFHKKPWCRARASQEYWETLQPATGRPHSSCFSHPDDWDMTKGAELLKQGGTETTEVEIETLKQMRTHMLKRNITQA